jgi:hypothetical protein
MREEEQQRTVRTNVFSEGIISEVILIILLEIPLADLQPSNPPLFDSSSSFDPPLTPPPTLITTNNPQLQHTNEMYPLEVFPSPNYSRPRQMSNQPKDRNSEIAE